MFIVTIDLNILIPTKKRHLSLSNVKTSSDELPEVVFNLGGSKRAKPQLPSRCTLRLLLLKTHRKGPGRDCGLAPTLG